MMERKGVTIIKLGGSAITYKQAVKKPRIDVINQVSEEISQIYNKTNLKLVLVLGGGSFGHPLAKKYQLHTGLRRHNGLIGVSETIEAMRELSMIVSKSLRTRNVPIIPIQPSALSINNNSHLESMHIDVLKKFLEIGAIPMLWGDVVIDRKLGVSILSGDNIISYLADKLNVEKIVFGLDIDGFFANPDTLTGLIKEICEKNLEKIVQLARGSKTTDVTGGMARKIEEIMPIYRKGIPIYLINITKKNYLYKTLILGENMGTIISKECKGETD